jgi:hypothetical protein
MDISIDKLKLFNHFLFFKMNSKAMYENNMFIIKSSKLVL